MHIGRRRCDGKQVRPPALAANSLHFGDALPAATIRGHAAIHAGAARPSAVRPCSAREMQTRHASHAASCSSLRAAPSSAGNGASITKVGMRAR